MLGSDVLSPGLGQQTAGGEPVCQLPALRVESVAQGLFYWGSEMKLLSGRNLQTGAVKNEVTQKWDAQIWINGEYFLLGSFDEKYLAVELCCRVVSACQGEFMKCDGVLS